MIIIPRSGVNDYDQASKFMDVAIEDFDKYNNYYTVLRKDIYLLVHYKAHEKMGSSRRQFFAEINYRTIEKKLNTNLICEFVNAALVESHLEIKNGEAPLDVLLSLRFKANKEDWENIYCNALYYKNVKIQELQQKQNNRRRKSRHLAWHLERMSLSPAPTNTTIINEIREYYKCEGNVKPKTRGSIYDYWDGETRTSKKKKDEDEEDDEYDLTSSRRRNLGITSDNDDDDDDDDF